jgi:hypothetical protein
MYPCYHQRYRGRVGLPSPYGPADAIGPAQTERMPTDGASGE